MSSYFQRVHESQLNYSIIFDLIKSEVVGMDLFASTDFEHNPHHKTFIVDLVVEEFIRIRLVRRARQITLDQHTHLIRSAKMHDIHFAGQ